MASRKSKIPLPTVSAKTVSSKADKTKSGPAKARVRNEPTHTKTQSYKALLEKDSKHEAEKKALGDRVKSIESERKRLQEEAASAEVKFEALLETKDEEIKQLELKLKESSTKAAELETTWSMKLSSLKTSFNDQIESEKKGSETLRESLQTALSQSEGKAQALESLLVEHQVDPISQTKFSLTRQLQEEQEEVKKSFEHKVNSLRQQLAQRKEQLAARLEHTQRIRSQLTRALEGGDDKSLGVTLSPSLATPSPLASLDSNAHLQDKLTEVKKGGNHNSNTIPVDHVENQ